MGALRTAIQHEDAPALEPADDACATALFAGNPAEAVEFARACRIAEALLFAAGEPLEAAALTERLPGSVAVTLVLEALQRDYASRGVNLVELAGKWMFRTAQDLGHVLSREQEEPRKLSRAALETLAIIAYHQPVTRAEIEDIRGVSTSRGTIDVLLETGWIRLRGRRKSPGRPITFGTTETFLIHFGLSRIDDLPGLDELKGTGFIDARLPPGFSVPIPTDDPSLRADEDPLGEDVFTAMAEEAANRVDEPLCAEDGA